MKRLILFFTLLLFICSIQAQNVGIGTSTPNVSAILELKDTTKGFLPPRMTYAQRNGINNPTAGLVIWCSDCYELQVYNGTIWTNMLGAAAQFPTLPNVTICNQIWMINNLDVSTYRNGDAIIQITDPSVWANLTTGAWCWYNNDSATYATTYGKLYNWYAMSDPRGLAPQGWHVPSISEWASLSNCLKGSSIAGGKMKEVGTSHWQTPNLEATNSSGFTGLPGGYRNYDGLFYNNEYYGFWWVSGDIGTTNVHYLYLNYSSEALTEYYSYRPSGFSVRCVKD